jgi:hypothetical protein
MGAQKYEIEFTILSVTLNIIYAGFLIFLMGAQKYEIEFTILSVKLQKYEIEFNFCRILNIPNGCPKIRD